MNQRIPNDSFNKLINNMFKYAQYCHISPNSQGPHDAVGKPLVHKSAIQQTTGIFFITILKNERK